MSKNNIKQRLLMYVGLTLIMMLSAIACKPKEYTIKNISTNSELIEPQHKGKYIYPAAYAFDNNIQTAWSEANFDYGKNTYLKVDFTEPVKVDEVQIINGFAKSERLFNNNNRVKDFEIIADGFKKQFQLRDKTREYQSIKLPKPIETKFLKFNIKTVYKGRYTDTLITDIKLLSGGKPIKITNFSSFLEKQKKIAMDKALEAGRSYTDYFHIVYANYNSTWYCPAFHSYYTFKSNGRYSFKLPGDSSEGTYVVKGHEIHMTPENRSEYGGSAPVLRVTFQPFGNHTIKINEFKCNRLN